MSATDIFFASFIGAHALLYFGGILLVLLFGKAWRDDAIGSWSLCWLGFAMFEGFVALGLYSQGACATP